MPRILGTGQVRKDNGSVVTPANGQWIDGFHFFNGSFAPQRGVLHSQSGDVGAGQKVSAEVNRQSDQAQGLTPGSIQKFVDQPIPQAQQPQQVTGANAPGLLGAGASAGDGSGSTGVLEPTPTIDLEAQFKSLFDQSGISAKEEDLAGKERAFTEAKGDIDDNPFLAEASRVGRQAKLQTLFDDRTRNLQDEIATKRADVETQLNLKLKQFDINSQVAKTELDKFNTLLSLGALDNASGQDIANITRSTGISSDMIQSAIKSRNKEDIETHVVTSEDDNGNVTISLINKKTGSVINQQNLGAIGNKQNNNPSTKINETELKIGLSDDVRSGRGVRDVFAIYSGHLTPDEIIQIYNANSPHGPAKESADELKRLGVDTEKLGIF